MQQSSGQCRMQHSGCIRPIRDCRMQQSSGQCRMQHSGYHHSVRSAQNVRLVRDCRMQQSSGECCTHQSPRRRHGSGNASRSRPRQSAGASQLHPSGPVGHQDPAADSPGCGGVCRSQLRRTVSAARQIRQRRRLRTHLQQLPQLEQAPDRRNKSGRRARRSL